MKTILLIARDEWRYWLRSKLAVYGVLIFMVLTVLTSIATATRIEAERHARSHQQAEAEATFLAQPDRHPHRMVHYGHYLFRTPAPLAVFDPGLDAVTGQSIFLEGHRQNTVMFADSAASADFGGLSYISPALVYQLFAPLVILLLGYGAVSRERESDTLNQLLALGVSSFGLVAGKLLALIAFVVVLLLPLLLSCGFALGSGAEPVSCALLVLAYFAYLSLWAMLTLLCSTICTRRSTALAVITGIWFSTALVVPSLAVNVAGNAQAAGKIATDFAMQADIRKLGDGHNANSPAFTALREHILKQYDVTRIEDLPINFRGLVALKAEQELTDVLTGYAESRMAEERDQTAQLTQFAWLSPSLALAFVSRSLAASDLQHYHRFQREAEAVRIDFVQGLNKAHMEELSYQDDINRNKDEASWLRARVGSSNWKVLNQFSFTPAGSPERAANARYTAGSLCAWLMLTMALLCWFGRKMHQ